MDAPTIGLAFMCLIMILGIPFGLWFDNWGIKILLWSLSAIALRYAFLFDAVRQQ